ncbi:MAG: hypothetical protein ACAH83_07515 [Alphaproteobacteria bacterium]
MEKNIIKIDFYSTYCAESCMKTGAKKKKYLSFRAQRGIFAKLRKAGGAIAESEKIPRMRSG